MRPEIALDEYLLIACGELLGPSEANSQRGPVSQPLEQAGVIFAARSQNQLLFGKTNLVRESLQFRPAMDPAVVDACRALMNADYFDFPDIVDQEQDLNVPGKKSGVRVGAETSLAAKSQAGATQFHADASLAPGSIQLATVSRYFAAECAEFIRVKAINPLDLAVQRRVEHVGNHMLLAVLGEKGDLMTGIGVQLGLADRLVNKPRLLMFRLPGHILFPGKRLMPEGLRFCGRLASVVLTGGWMGGHWNDQRKTMPDFP